MSKERGKTILLVEDNVDDAELTELAFKRANIINPMLILRDGVRALDYLFRRGRWEGMSEDDLPILILLDINIPFIDGFGVLSDIKSDHRLRQIPTVLLTSSQEQSDVRTGYGLGANSYIHKPVDFAQFIDVSRHIGLYWLALNTTPGDKCED